MYKNHTDQQLLENFYQTHDNQWIGALLQRYTLLLLGVCMKYLRDEEEAKDAVQQIFLKVITELHKYKVDYFKSWLYMVARNHCLMKIRDDHSRNHLKLEEDTYKLAEDASNQQLHLQKDQHLELMEATLQELNAEQKLCVTLFYLRKQSYQQIAGTTGFSVMQVKSHIQNGKRNLKILMDKKLNSPS
jgi:RNA polymerase sigma-70 factor (ECF subfamily)